MLSNLLDRIADRINVNLRELRLDVGPWIVQAIPPEKLSEFYAFYGIGPDHPLRLRFRESALAGSYFLGRCEVDHSVVYKSDVRGDELKNAGDILPAGELTVRLHEDERITIRDSFLVKTLVHNNSHDPEDPEEFYIRNTAAMAFANIHGAPVEGCFLGAFSTVDLTTVHDSVVGELAYVQTGELSHERVAPGRIWIRGESFEFDFQHDPEVVARYVRQTPGRHPEGILVDFVLSRQEDFTPVFEFVITPRELQLGANASVSEYAVVKGDCEIAENVLIAQRGYVDSSQLGPGANVQERCFIVNSRLRGCNVSAHGAKVCHADMGENVFTGFNSFCRGTPDAPLKVGAGSMIFPHTIIDLKEPLEIPSGTAVWGYVTNAADLSEQSVPLSELTSVSGEIKRGRMTFRGDGKLFVEAFQHRIQHILEENGAFCRGDEGRGHAQRSARISFNILQPHRAGERAGLCPTMEISE